MGKYGQSSSSRKGLYVTDNDLGPKVYVFNNQQLRNDTGPILRKALKRKNDAIELEEQEKLRCLEETRDGSPDEAMGIDLVDDVLMGNIELEPSHAGGEFLAILLDNDYGQQPRTKYKDPRTRRDRVQDLVFGFSQQMEKMVDAFIKWEYECEKLGNEKAPIRDYSEPQGRSFLVIDVFSAYNAKTDIEDSEIGIVSELILHGMIPTAPYRPHHAFSIRVIELYNHVQLRCPHLSIEAFVKGLCDIHGQPYHPTLSKQFSIAYDIYLEIRNKIQLRVAGVLQRDSHRWWLRNVCSACTYKLVNEPQLVFSMLVTMDGNDSMKRVIRSVPDETAEEGNEGTRKVVSRELPDPRKPTGDYYLSHEDVDRFAKEEFNENIPVENDSPCAPRWNNMNKERISRMWGVFDESGIFLSLCRHGYMLVVADMVQSREQSKYPLAVVDALLDTFGSKIAIGYDIGCRFSKTIASSSLGQWACELELTSLVGSFHGHVHNRLCQLSHLATYVKGLGLEDLEGCERFFSKSNALASLLCYASIFHQQQKIVEFMKHMDKQETSQQLSEFLIRNYKQALNIIKGEAELHILMRTHSVEDMSVFQTWLDEEHNYLLNLSKELVEETFEIEYYLKLKELNDAKQKLEAFTMTFIQYDPSRRGKKDTNSLKQYHACEHMNNLTRTLEGLEDVIQLACCWEPGMEEWNWAEQMAYQRDYQRALDNLERLVVQHMFELTRMNMSQTGYKLRKHIAKALRTRSEAIRTALDKYNTAAKNLRPPQPTLSWDEVVEYSFLSDFDLLRDTRQDIRKRPGQLQLVDQ